jgi:serine/threonine protein kinase
MFADDSSSDDEHVLHHNTSNDNLLKGRYRFSKNDEGERVRIGEGESSFVFKAVDVYDEEPVAIKVSKYSDELHKGASIREAKKIQDLRHPNIVECYDAFFGTDDEEEEMVVMEFCELGDLNHYLANFTPSPQLKLELMLQVTEAVRFLHDAKKTMHRDIKPGNVLISGTSEHPIAKICDFGTAKSIEPSTFANSYVGTPAFLAPEVGADPYSLKADIFSLGVLFCCLLTGDGDLSMLRMSPAVLVRNGLENDLLRKIEWAIRREDVAYLPLIRSMLKKQPDDRPDLNTIIAELLKLRA